VPDLSATEEAAILGFLKQAREEAVDFKNVNQISAIFEIYKTKSEQYLNSQGATGKSSSSLRRFGERKEGRGRCGEKVRRKRHKAVGSGRIASISRHPIRNRCLRTLSLLGTSSVHSAPGNTHITRVRPV